jgi:hypothetical protein
MVKKHIFSPALDRRTRFAMKRFALLIGLFLATLPSAADADAAQKQNESQRARLLRLLDTNGDGVISIPERGIGRIYKGAYRAQRALGKNERTVRKIK